GAGAEDLSSPAAPPMTTLGDDLDSDGAFLDTAAILPQLELVVTCDTSLGHVSGALGVECWTALSQVPDWRWVLGRDDSPWYPRHRLFRQKRLGEWPEVFQRIADGVRQRISERTDAVR
ncbi:MAG TPA: hypothetical protein PLV92_16590, partial [Pirellulaceae bacterium]|nr:hypothetical protein [Pirellulaceae bacterium]